MDLEREALSQAGGFAELDLEVLRQSKGGSEWVAKLMRTSMTVDRGPRVVVLGFPISSKGVFEVSKPLSCESEDDFLDDKFLLRKLARFSFVGDGGGTRKRNVGLEGLKLGWGNMDSTDRRDGSRVPDGGWSSPGTRELVYLRLSIVLLAAAACASVQGILVKKIKRKSMCLSPHPELNTRN